MRFFFFVMAALATLALTLGSLLKLNLEQVPKLLFRHSDKVLHFTAYFVLAISWFFAFTHKINLKNKLIISILVVGYGILMEFLQGFATTYREPDFYDFIANALGVFMAFVSYGSLNKLFLKVLQSIRQQIL